MTIASTVTSVQYVRNGTTTQWSYPNKIFSAADLIVSDILGATVTPLVLGTDYTVANVDVDTGCTVTTTVAGTAGHTLDIRSNIAELQSTSIKNQGVFLPELHEEAFDRFTRELQDLRRLTYSFGIHGPDTEATPWTQLPSALVRAGNMLTFDGAGNPILSPQPTAGTTQAQIGALLWPKTPIEITAGTTIVASWYEPYDVRRYGADQTGAADSTAAFNAAPNASLVFPGTYLTNSPVTAGKPIISFNAVFTGTNPVNGWMPAFGSNDFVVMEFLGGNAMIGAVLNVQGGTNLTGVAIAGTAGQFSCTAGPALAVGGWVFTSGAFGGTGSLTGYSNPTSYKISATNGSTTFTLTTASGGALVTTAGTPTGLTYLYSSGAGVATFPTGTTGYSRQNTAGNAAFGLYGQADLWSAGNAIGTESDSFNYVAPATGSLPANLGFGTPQFNPIAFLASAGGNFSSLAAFYAANGPQTFVAAFYVHPGAASQYGLLIDAGSLQGPSSPLYVKGLSSVIPVVIQTTSAFAANNAVLSVLDASIATHMSIKQDGHIAWSATATSATTGANGAPPAQVAGYFIAEVIGGSLVKIPYYNT